MNKNQKGNAIVIAVVIGAMMITLMMLTAGVLMGCLNAMIHQLKTDLFLINRSAIVSVNKNRANIDDFSYDKKVYEKFFLDSLKKNYHLNEELENQEGLVQKVQIEEYTIYRNKQIDSLTGKRVDRTMIHTVLTVKVKPIILEKQLSSLFVFQLHEDVPIEFAKN